MKIIYITVTTLTAIIAITTAQDCYFDFEDASEMDNFDVTCDGEKGAWDIANTSTFDVAPPLDYEIGDRVLSLLPGERACMRTVKDIPLEIENPKVTVFFFWEGTQSGYTELTISFLCGTIKKLWDVVGGKIITEPGQWYREENTIDIPSGSCKIEISSYHSSQTIAIDRIELTGVNAANCYVVQKPTKAPDTSPTPTSTKDPTLPSTTTDPTLLPTTTDPTSLPSTTTDPTLLPTTTDPTTLPTTTDPTPLPTTTDPTLLPTTTDPRPQSVTETSSSSPPTYQTDAPDSPNDAGATSGFSMLYIVTIVSAAGGLAIISAISFCCIKSMIPRVRKWQQKRRSTITKPFMPKKISLA